jgi:hypothetical protein
MGHQPEKLESLNPIYDSMPFSETVFVKAT